MSWQMVVVAACLSARSMRAELTTLPLVS